MSILDDILEHKREEVAAAKRLTGLERLRESPGYSRPCASLRASLLSTKPAIIAEVKKASPSKGTIRQNFDPVAIAREYTSNGAAGISVLTDSKFFQGSISHLENIRNVTGLPLLRKDFLIDPYQIHEAKASGADVVLLIAAALTPTELHDLAGEARSLGLETLVEVHSVSELAEIDLGRIDLLGINNRDLKSFSVDLNVSVNIRKHLPNEVICISESGIRTADDMVRLMSEGIDAFLIGESFMRKEHPGEALAEMLVKVRSMQEA